MGTCERFSIGNLRESLRKRAGKALGVMAAAAWVVSGCAAPTPCNAEQQEQKNPTADTQIQKATLTLTGKLLTGAVETTLTANQESGQTQPSQRLVTALRYCTDILMTTFIKAVSPPSPTAPNAATLRQQLKTTPRQPLRQHPLQQAAIKLDITVYPRQIATPLL